MDISIRRHSSLVDACKLLALCTLAAAALAGCGGGSGSDPTQQTTASGAVAPQISAQPQNTSVAAGQTATFSVTATGTAPLSYQWSKNATAISGATSASYTTPATSAGDNGASFTVAVSNSAGSIASSTATLTVTGGSQAVAPTITTQPQSQTVAAGAKATFTVVASGTAPLGYQWSRSGTAIAGATSASYTTPVTVSGDSGSTFSVQVSNTAGSTTSNAATLTVTAAAVAPAITTQPQNQTVAAGAKATFTVVASGTAPLGYQWSKNGTAIAGATGASYTTPATVSGDSGSTFSVQVSNTAGSTTSNAATLTVNQLSGSGAPIMFQHIASSTNPAGNGIGGHTFTFHTESLPANTVAVMGVSALASINVTISDTLVGSWSAALCNASGGTGNTKASVFVQSLGATGGADTITINVGSSDTQPVQFDITFWENISTTSPANGSLCQGNIKPGSGGSISPGSFTPTTNNDTSGGNVIWNYTPICSATAGGNPTKWVPASGFSLLNGDIIWTNDQGFPEASQYYLQAAQASVTPSITATGDTADCFNSTSVALMVANNGATAPSAIHVASIIHESFVAFTAPGTQVIQTPTVGNLRILGFTWEGGCPGGANQCLGSISSSDGCAWILLGGTNAAAEQAYAEDCSPCSTCTVSITYTGSGTLPQASFRFYDIENASTSSYQNSTGAEGACTSPMVSAPVNFTPTGANSGLTIATIGNGNGPITGLAAGSPAATFDLWTYTDQTDTDLADNADGQAHYYYSSKASQTWNWAKQNSNDQCYWWASNYN
ncbi:MAG TPA: immunoglobulin domain-containing protein [Candidatus Dormibacteraeota bacterium]|nr:immunoglobulin domain-containing protein [Candidatus Dormibacteraeota bacterium]